MPVAEESLHAAFHDAERLLDLLDGLSGSLGRTESEIAKIDPTAASAAADLNRLRDRSLESFDETLTQSQVGFNNYVSQYAAVLDFKGEADLLRQVVSELLASTLEVYAQAVSQCIEGYQEASTRTATLSALPEPHRGRLLSSLVSRPLEQLRSAEPLLARQLAQVEDQIRKVSTAAYHTFYLPQAGSGNIPPRIILNQLSLTEIEGLLRVHVARFLGQATWNPKLADFRRWSIDEGTALRSQSSAKGLGIVSQLEDLRGVYLARMTPLLNEKSLSEKADVFQRLYQSMRGLVDAVGTRIAAFVELSKTIKDEPDNEDFDYTETFRLSWIEKEDAEDRYERAIRDVRQQAAGFTKQI